MEENEKVTITEYLNEKFPPIEEEEIEDFSDKGSAANQFARIEARKKAIPSVQTMLKRLQANKNKI